MTMLRILFFVAPSALAQEFSSGQCMVQPGKQYQNCWGDDLDWAPADSFEECCEKCASMDKCEFFTFDAWNHDGEAQNYCFFKYGCSDVRQSSTAVSGSLKRKSTTLPFTTTSGKDTSTTEPATGTTAAPASTTSSTRDPQPQCGAPHTVAGLGAAGGRPQNVSSMEACCASCEAPACTYVTYGRYAHVEEELWACYHHASDRNITVLRSRQSGAFLTLYDDENSEEGCAALGLVGCAGVAVVAPGPQPPTDAGLPTGAFVGAGAASFLVAVPLGYLVSKKLMSFSTK